MFAINQLIKFCLLSEFEQQNSTLQEAIQTINQALKIFDQQLVTIKHEQFDMEYLVFSLVAPIPTLILQQKVMRPNDYKYFEAVLRLILNSEEYSIRHKVALTASVGASRRSISGDNEHLLKLWTSLGYFTIRDGTVYLGPKSMVEFKGFIHSEYPDIKTCDLCYNLTFLVSILPLII